LTIVDRSNLDHIVITVYKSTFGSAHLYPLAAMPGPTPHRTPLRRVSQGSLFALSRSGAHTDAPHGLGFLEPALAELADEAEALRANVEGLRALSASLDTFNEAFASWLFVMNMNALTVEWPEVSKSLRP
jgi:DASH complex subunit DAM1